MALSKKEQVVAQEVAVSVSQERERQMQTFLDQIQQLEAAYASKQEELEEMRRSFVSQKRSLKQALAAASDDQAQSSADEAASALVATQAMAEELESLHQQLSAITVRHNSVRGAIVATSNRAQCIGLSAPDACSGAASAACARFHPLFPLLCPLTLVIWMLQWPPVSLSHTRTRHADSPPAGGGGKGGRGCGAAS